MCAYHVALYGHLDSGTGWGNSCDESLNKSVFISVGDGAWPSCYFRTELGLLLSGYVDDAKLAGPAKHMTKCWQLVASNVELDPLNH